MRFAEEWAQTHSFLCEMVITTGDNAETVRRIWLLLEPALARDSIELVEVECGNHGPNTLLRIFLDKENGIDLDACADASRLIGALLDGEDDLLPGAYTLEVSSPGIDRPVRKAGDFARFKGETIRIKTNAPVSGRKSFKGTLTGIDHDLVSVDCDGESFDIHLENLRRANLVR